MLNGILPYRRSVDPICLNYMDKRYYHFQELHAAVDNLGSQI